MANAPNISRWLKAPALTRGRIWLAFSVAAVTDAIQLGLGPAGGIVVDQVLDVIAMVLTCAALGFHPLLLPTFVIELIPIADMIPTWTGCVAAVVLLRKRLQPQPPVPPPVPNLVTDSPAPPVIEDVKRDA